MVGIAVRQGYTGRDRDRGLDSEIIGADRTEAYVEAEDFGQRIGNLQYQG